MAKIIISLPDELLEKVDLYCTENDYNRSEFIRFALRKLIKRAEKAKKDVEA
jgi:metal-responsive CopG/Arc/MetJ family transcriptional regulator